MSSRLWKTPLRFLIRRSVRYLLVANGFRLVQLVVVFLALSFVLTGSRIVLIDRFGNRADIVAAIFVTIAAMSVLRAFNRRVMTAIDRRFFREAYNAQLILTELGEQIPALSKIDQVIELIADRVDAALHPERATIFIEDESTSAYVAAYSFHRSVAREPVLVSPPKLSLPDGSPLMEQLRSAHPAIAVEFAGAVGLTMIERKVLTEAKTDLVIPLRMNGHVYGFVALGRRLSGLPYSQDDKRLLLVVAHQLAAFFANLRLISRMAEEERVERELALAAEVQRQLFPAGELGHAGLEIYGTCRPARGVGGDYYDYFALNDDLTGIAVADVAGKGIAAALLMSTVQASLRCQLTGETRNLAEIVTSMNRLLRRSTGEGGYATFFFAEFDHQTNGLTYVNAGHNPPLLVHRRPRQNSLALADPSRGAIGGYLQNGTVPLIVAATRDESAIELLTTGGPIIGTFLDGPYEQETIEMRTGDTLVVYTDGVTEALNETGEEFGEDRLRSLVLETTEWPVSEIVDAVISRLQGWQGTAAQHDDITLIVARAT